jgi:hypothetical protein
MLRQPDRGLTVAGRAVPGQLRSRRSRRQLGEEARRIARAVRGVLRRAAREQVLESRQLFFAVFTNTDENV